MNLLILTQKIKQDDSVLGFFNAWVREFARRCGKVTVVCLQKGGYDLPENVRVLSLGKEGGVSRVKYLFKFYQYIWQERKNYDAVFVHMNPVYVVLGGIFWRVWGKKIALWYTHRSVDMKLRLAEKCADIVFTASRESFRLPSKKLRVMGHGIPVGKFRKSDKNTSASFPSSRLYPQVAGSDAARHENFPKYFKSKNKIRIVTIGRISPVKDYETLIRAAGILRQCGGIDYEIKIFGGAETKEQKFYEESLKRLVKEGGLEEMVYFCGAISPDEVPEVLAGADIFTNMSRTGGLDKAVLEAAAAGVPVLTCNETLAPDFTPFGVMFEKGDAEELAEKIWWLANSPDERKRVGESLRKIVEEKHDLAKLIPKILNAFSEKEI